MRTKKWCLSKGLVYTGYSSRLSLDLKLKLDELRAAGYTAYLSQWDKDPLSRSPGTGYSIYADKRWSLDQEEKMVQCKLDRIPQHRATVRETFEKTMEAIEKEEIELKWRLTNIGIEKSVITS